MCFFFLGSRGVVESRKGTTVSLLAGLFYLDISRSVFLFSIVTSLHSSSSEILSAPLFVVSFCQLLSCLDHSHFFTLFFLCKFCQPLVRRFLLSTLVLPTSLPCFLEARYSSFWKSSLSHYACMLVLIPASVLLFLLRGASVVLESLT